MAHYDEPRVEVREERGKYNGFVVMKDDEYPAALEMLSYDAAFQGALGWARWMGYMS